MEASVKYIWAKIIRIMIDSGCVDNGITELLNLMFEEDEKNS